MFNELIFESYLKEKFQELGKILIIKESKECVKKDKHICKTVCIEGIPKSEWGFAFNIDKADEGNEIIAANATFWALKQALKYNEH